jgi:hypothetical protein
MSCAVNFLENVVTYKLDNVVLQGGHAARAVGFSSTMVVEALSTPTKSGHGGLCKAVSACHHCGSRTSRAVLFASLSRGLPSLAPSPLFTIHAWSKKREEELACALCCAVSILVTAAMEGLCVSKYQYIYAVAAVGRHA